MRCEHEAVVFTDGACRATSEVILSIPTILVQVYLLGSQLHPISINFSHPLTGRYSSIEIQLDC
jgi:hypothetical protein